MRWFIILIVIGTSSFSWGDEVPPAPDETIPGMTLDECIERYPLVTA